MLPPRREDDHDGEDIDGNLPARTVAIRRERLATDEDRRAEAIGVGFATALPGARIFVMKLHMTPDAAFSVLDWTAYVPFIVGGSGKIGRPFVGTIVFFVLRALLAGFGPIYLVLLGTVAIAVMLFAPGGLWGLIHTRTGWELFPTRRRRL